MLLAWGQDPGARASIALANGDYCLIIGLVRLLDGGRGPAGGPTWYNACRPWLAAAGRSSRAGITQLVEYELPKLEVAGSIPVARSKEIKKLRHLSCNLLFVGIYIGIHYSGDTLGSLNYMVSVAIPLKLFPQYLDF